MKDKNVKKIEVVSNQYKIVNIQDNMVLYTLGLNEEIAYTVFSSTLGKVGLVRSLDINKLKEFFLNINPDNFSEAGLIDIHIVGGNKSSRSKEYLRTLIEALKDIDNNTDVINIKSYDVCERIHPNSFKLDCYHGGIS